jgi:hypothetical protein
VCPLDCGEHQRRADPLAVSDRIERHDLEHVHVNIEGEQSDKRPAVVLRDERVELCGTELGAVRDDRLAVPPFVEERARPLALVGAQRPDADAQTQNSTMFRRTSRR